MIRILFLFISMLGLLMAAGTVLARNLVHAALFLVGFFFVVACLFVLLEAEFLAVVQVLIYIGAVAVLLLFGIMLTRNIQGDETTTVTMLTRVPAALVGLGVLVILIYGISDQKGLRDQPSWKETMARPALPGPAQAKFDPTSRASGLNDMGRTVGFEMMTRYVIPFEIAGLLLTAAVVGAIALAQLEVSANLTPGRGRPAAAGAPPTNGQPATAPGSSELASVSSGQTP